MPNPNPKRENLTPFRKGYDPRRAGNGRKREFIVSRAIEDGISIEAIAEILCKRALQGSIPALRQIFQIMGWYHPRHRRRV